MKYLFCILYILLLSACTKKLKQHPLDKLSPATAFSNRSDLQLYTNSFYEILPTASNINHSDATSDYLARSDISQYLNPGAYTSANAGGWTWNDLRNVNFFLEHVRHAKSEIQEDVLEHYIGIARFFRAWIYFHKVKTYGDVPWYNKALDVADADLYKGRDPRTLIMDSVLADLDYASTHINSEKDNTSSQITKWVALAFKSRVCLFEGTFRKYHTELNLQGTTDKWLQQCVDAAKEVMNSGKYKLHEDAGNPALSYREVFTQTKPPSDEVILAAICNSGLQIYNDANWYFTSTTYGKRLSFTKTFIDTYLNRDGSRYTNMNDFDTIPFWNEVKDRDLRLQQTIRTVGYKRSDGTPAPPDFSYTYTGYQPIKFTLDSKATDGQARNNNSLPIIRYAEVLLNYAEAKAELGNFKRADWDATIKLLRMRAGIGNTSMPTTADHYLQEKYFPNISDPVLLEIRRERGIELALEGFRFDDLLRWKSGDLLEAPYVGMYVPKLNEPYDLDQDGKPDVEFVTKIPTSKDPGVYYYLIDNNNIELSNGDHGKIIWMFNTKRVWKNYRYYHPIPITQIDLNPELKQNPGWE